MVAPDKPHRLTLDVPLLRVRHLRYRRWPTAPALAQTFACRPLALVLDVIPRIASRCHRHRRDRHTIFGCELHLRLASGIPLANVQHSFAGQPARLPLSVEHVGGVVLLRTAAQMRRVATRRVIAGVSHGRWPLASRQFVDQPGSYPRLLTDRDLPIAVLATSDPQPALVWTTHIDLRPQPLNNRPSPCRRSRVRWTPGRCRRCCRRALGSSSRSRDH